MNELKELRARLNIKQQKFAEAYVKSGNATQSAIEAGYSARSAEMTGSRMIRNDKVSAYIEGLRDEMMDDTILSGKEVLYRLSQIALAEIKEIDVAVVKTAKYIDNPNSDNGKKQLVYNESLQLIEKPPKIGDQNKALELLGKHHKLFTDKQELEVTTPTIINDIPLDD